VQVGVSHKQVVDVMATSQCRRLSVHQLLQMLLLRLALLLKRYGDACAGGLKQHGATYTE
jgi:hypothetical protein